ncbi:MAG: RNA polymerase factor sigma-54 [bacterium]
MRLEQNLQTRLELSHVLLQRLDLLLLPLLDLRQLVEQAIEQNPVLENDTEKENEESTEKEEPKEKEEPTEDVEDWDTYPKLSETAEKKEEMPVPAPPPTLKESLILQSRLTFTEERLLKISECIIYELNEDGFLTSSTKGIAEILNEDEETVLSVLRKIQTFDPVGVGSRDIKEYLLIQLHLKNDTPEIAFEIIEKHFEDLVHSNYEKILESMNTTQAELDEVIARIKLCNLKPGAGMGGEIRYVLPDLTLQRVDDNGQAVWIVYPNNEWIPKLRLSKLYLNMLHNQDNAIDKDAGKYLRQNIATAKLLIEGIEKRRETINKIAGFIKDSILDFLDNKTRNFNFVTLEEVGAAIGRNPSTVSRAIQDKWIQTPYGLLTLKSFFSMHKPKAYTEVTKRLQEVVSGEDKKHPLRDDQILSILQNEGFKLARTTVVKYRTLLGIPPGHKRKQ